MKGKTYPYNNVYDPAFPSLPIIIQNSEEGFRTDTVDALLDTGADGTMIPTSLLQEINAPPL